MCKAELGGTQCCSRGFKGVPGRCTVNDVLDGHGSLAAAAHGNAGEACTRETTCHGHGTCVDGACEQLQVVSSTGGAADE